MQIPREFFQDKLALGISSASLVVAVATILLIIAKALGGSTGSFVVAYRANLGIEAFESGGVASFIGLTVFALVIFVAQLLLAWRTYKIERRLAIGVLATGLFLLLLDLIIGNALLALH